MSHTTRWWHKPHIQFRLKLRHTDSEFNESIHKQHNPRYYRHERKILRINLHRQTRHKNKIRLQKGLDFEPEVKTNGWLTH